MSDNDKNNIKKTYLEFVQIASRSAEEMTDDVMSEYGKWSKFLSPDYKNTVYNTFFQMFQISLQKLLEEVENTEDLEDVDHLLAVVSDFIGEYKYNEKNANSSWGELFPPFDPKDEYMWDDLVDKTLTKYIEEIWNEYLQKQVIRTVWSDVE